MKNLTSFKILTLMILAVGSSQVFGRELSKKENLAFQRQTIRAELSANNIEDETDGIMKILAQLHPGILEKIVKEERNLDANYSDIKRFLRDLNEEIETLSEQKNIKDTKIARLAVELADAQAMFKKYIARERSEDKRNDSREEKITNLLVNAQSNLKAIIRKIKPSGSTPKNCWKPRNHSHVANEVIIQRGGGGGGHGGGMGGAGGKGHEGGMGRGHEGARGIGRREEENSLLEEEMLMNNGAIQQDERVGAMSLVLNINEK